MLLLNAVPCHSHETVPYITFVNMPMAMPYVSTRLYIMYLRVQQCSYTFPHSDGLSRKIWWFQVKQYECK